MIAQGKPVKASVIICAHNPRNDYFERCLAGLKAQTLEVQSWELIVIDNASQPDSAPHPDLSWHPRGRMVVEKELGLTPAVTPRSWLGRVVDTLQIERIF